MNRPPQNLEWYECTLDGKIAFITADLNLYDGAPQEERPISARFVFPLRSPKENGLPQQQEFETLHDLELKLEDHLWERLQAVLAGKIFSAGERRVYFYLASKDGLREAVGSLPEDFDAYEFRWGTCEDPEWEEYLEMLYPNPLGFQYISDRHLLNTLKQEGDPLTQPREVSHWIYFQDEATATGYLRAREAEGFQRIALERKSEADEDRLWMVQISRTDKVDLDSITKLTHHLWISADKVGGEYDGWECQVQ